MLFTPVLAILGNNLNLPYGIEFYYILIFWAYGVFFIFHRIANGLRLKLPKVLYFLLFFILYELIWSFFNGDIERRGFLKIIVNNVQLSSFFVILIIYNTKFSEKFIQTAIGVIKFTVVVAAIVSIIQVFRPGFLLFNYADTDLLSENIYELRRVSIFGYRPLAYGFTFIPLLSIIVAMMHYRSGKFPMFFLALGGISAFLTNTRFIMISFVLLSIQFLVIYGKKLAKLSKYVFVFALLFFTLLTAISNLGYDIQAWYQERLFAEGSILETTRYRAIENFLYFFPKYYMLGNGEGLTHEIEAASQAIGSSQIHVGYLSSLVYYGIVGSLFLFGFWFSVTKMFYRTAINTGYWGSFFAMLTYLWAQLTLVHFTMFFYGLIFVFVFDKYYHDKHLVSKNS
ncbi:MAG: hypothetical protein K9H06_18800 [Melioribacteraceae bacterium]|nr:hypothetical protein [Melioribacteraceae bacterium]